MILMSKLIELLFQLQNKLMLHLNILIIRLQIFRFLEEEAIDGSGEFIEEKHHAVNKIGHALHELDPVFSNFSYSSDIKKLARGVGLRKPSMIQSMVICKQPFIGGEVNIHQDPTFLYTEPETCVGFWIALEDATVENGCMWAAAGGHSSSLRHRFRKNGEEMEMITLDESPMPICGTPWRSLAAHLSFCMGVYLIIQLQTGHRNLVMHTLCI